MAKTLNGLLYCPECGGDPALQIMDNLAGGGLFRVSCKKCFVKTLWYKNADKAEAEWNRIATKEGESNGFDRT